jgi:hypothetical protein
VAWSLQKFCSKPPKCWCSGQFLAIRDAMDYRTSLFCSQPFIDFVTVVTVVVYVIAEWPAPSGVRMCLRRTPADLDVLRWRSRAQRSTTASDSIRPKQTRCEMMNTAQSVSQSCMLLPCLLSYIHSYSVVGQTLVAVPVLRPFFRNCCSCVLLIDDWLWCFLGVVPFNLQLDRRQYFHTLRYTCLTKWLSLRWQFLLQPCVHYAKY